MPHSTYKARAVKKKTREVASYHYDTELPGKPLHLVIPGGLMALACLLAIIGVAHQTWIEHVWEESRGIGTLVLLVPVYIGSVFMFSYGYELYDADRALKLTGWIVLLTLGVVLIVAVLFCLIAGAGNSDSSSKSSSKSKDKSDSSGDSSSGSLLESFFGSGNSSGATTTYNSTPIELSFPTIIQQSNESPAAEAPPPEPIQCKFCQAEYIPEENKFTCPKCGAPSHRSEEAAE